MPHVDFAFRLQVNQKFTLFTTIARTGVRAVVWKICDLRGFSNPRG